MLTPMWRLVLVTLMAVLAWEYAETLPGVSVVLSVVATQVAIGFVRAGTVGLAWQAMQRDDADRARALLAKTMNPTWLSTRHRAIHRFIDGGLAVQDGDLDRAVDRLTEATTLTLPSATATATAWAMLASAHLGRGEVEAARRALEAGDTLALRDETRALLDTVRAQLPPAD